MNKMCWFLWSMLAFLGGAFSFGSWLVYQEYSAHSFEKEFQGAALPESMQQCFATNDYACFAKLSYLFPSAKNTQKQKLIAAKSLAYMGDIDAAMEIYRSGEVEENLYEISGAVMVYLITHDRAYEINSLLNQISNMGAKLDAVSSAHRTLGNHSHLAFYDQIHEIANNLLDEINQDHSSHADLNVPYSLIVPHFEKLKRLAANSPRSEFKAKLLLELDRHRLSAQDYGKYGRFEAQLAGLLKDGNQAGIVSFLKSKLLQRYGSEPEDWALGFYIRKIHFLKISPDNNPALLDRLVSALLQIAEMRAAKSCTAQITAEIAELYLRSGWKSKGLNFLQSRKISDPQNYFENRSEQDGACLLTGYFRNASMEALMGNASELLSGRFEAKLRMNHSSDIKFAESARKRIGFSLMTGGAYASPNDRKVVVDYLAGLYRRGHEKGEYIDEKTAFHFWNMEMIDKLLAVGEAEQAIKFARDVFEATSDDRRSEISSELLLPRLVGHPFHFAEIKNATLWDAKRR